jgi:hypothetical protein
MRWYEIIRESDDIVDQTHDAVMDILTPLQSQGISTITMDQIMQQLQSDPTLAGTDISPDLVQQALSGASNISVAPDTANAGKLTITMNNNSPTTNAAQAKTEKGEQKVNQAALRQSTKNLGQ